MNKITKFHAFFVQHYLMNANNYIMAEVNECHRLSKSFRLAYSLVTILSPRARSYDECHSYSERKRATHKKRAYAIIQL